MNAFALKIIALIAMIIDHVGVVFPLGFEFRVVGRLAFPIYVFLVAEGFRYTKSHTKFLVRLFAFAIISEPLFDMVIHGAHFPGGVNFFADTNIFYTLFLGGAAITAYEWIRTRYLTTAGKIPFIISAFALLFAFMWLAEFTLTTDYGAYGVVFIFSMYLIRHKKLRLIIMAILCVWQHNWVLRFAFSEGIQSVPILFWMLIPATLVTVLLAAFYNGKRGPSFKWFFYASYPVHLAVLALVASF